MSFNEEYFTFMHTTIRHNHCQEKNAGYQHCLLQKLYCRVLNYDSLVISVRSYV